MKESWHIEGDCICLSNGRAILDINAIGGETEEDVQNNIRIITAAPELLSLFQQMVNDRKQWRDNKISITDYELAMRHNIDDAERLIAKAEGRV